MTKIAFREPQCGHTSLNVCNVHFHHLTAKRHTGFAEAKRLFWPCLAATIHRYDVRILAGDFNMSMWEVVPQLRSLGIRIDIAACCPWLKAEGTRQQLKLDSCGIFIVGGASSVSLWHGPNVYEKLVPLSLT